MRKQIRIQHRQTKEILAEGPLGLNHITKFEGNYYIPKKYLKTNGFKSTAIPGLCIYKFIYIWQHLELNNGQKLKLIAWMYVVPNPLFWFVAFKTGISANSNEFIYTEI